MRVTAFASWFAVVAVGSWVTGRYLNPSGLTEAAWIHVTIWLATVTVPVVFLAIAAAFPHARATPSNDPARAAMHAGTTAALVAISAAAWASFFPAAALVAGVTTTALMWWMPAFVSARPGPAGSSMTWVAFAASAASCAAVTCALT